MDLAILGIGVAQPEFAIEQTTAAEVAVAINRLSPDTARTMQMLYRRTRVQSRSSVLLERNDGGFDRQSFFAPSVDELDRGPSTAERMARYATAAAPLALAASRNALQQAGVAMESIQHLVTASCTGFSAPGFDVALVENLSLSRDVSRTHIGFMGCHAAINALRVASALAAEKNSGNVLVCATELCSLHFQYGQEPDTVVSNALFADGAAAVVCGPATRENDAWRLTRTGSHLFAASQEAMSWQIADNGFEMKLSATVPELIGRSLRPWLENWLSKSGHKLESVGSWAIHPGGPRIVGAVCEALELPSGADEPSRQVLAECGNMSSPTILFILQRLQQKNASRPCVALGFGPGLALEVALFE